MLTKLEFLHQLKDASKQGKKEIFNSFLEKYRNTFNTIISIQYSDKKYNNIDIEEIFYNGFLTYTIKQLEKSECDTESIDKWVDTLAQERAKIIGEKVTKSCAKYFLENGGHDNWKNFNATLMDEAFSRVVGNVVARCFDNPKYKGYFNDIKISLLILFYEDGIGKSRVPSEPIENIDSYVYEMLKNFALRAKVRKSINAELGLEDDFEDITIYERAEAKKYDDSDADDEMVQADEAETPEMPPIDDTYSTNDKRLAEQQIEEYLKLMPRKDQAELLRIVMLGDYDRKELANEMGCTRAALDIRISHAMESFYKVALPHIRYRCKHMVITNIDTLTNEYEKDILKDFFLSNETLKELAQAYGKTESEFTKDLISAYKKVKSILAKTKKTYKFISDKEIEKYNKEERKQEAKSTLIKTKTITLKM